MPDRLAEIRAKYDKQMVMPLGTPGEEHLPDTGWLIGQVAWLRSEKDRLDRALVSSMSAHADHIRELECSGAPLASELPRSARCREILMESLRGVSNGHECTQSELVATMSLAVEALDNYQETSDE